MSIDWFPSAIALCITCTVVIGMRLATQAARTIAVRRTRAAIERALEQHG